MNPPPRRKLPVARPGMAPFLPGRPCDARPVAAATMASTRLPTVLALHAAMLLSGATLGCGSADGGDGIQADHHRRLATSATSTTPSTSSSTVAPGTMASTFLDPDPHDVDGQRMVVSPPPIPTTPHTIATTAPTWKGTKTGGVKPPVHPVPTPVPTHLGGRMIGPRPSATIGGTAPCPPRDPGASST